ncbi:hydroxymethylglutaryl-CoA reductase [Paramicrobacterium agarici]|uniref:3-hydroxy-3-methylglutaryl-coenzyme A reductase n=1 Tax=Paramicrobacterium agarici TaxID=630514 RepID=A0A2A9DXN7_9MICO|nr:hydroxymethylglutaryl-CoA reductase [Microbacterium agarici]PFG31567.1 3-hydroxy-3-methylglutaryl-coenzyme A reductase [Microbacterium agarici]
MSDTTFAPVPMRWLGPVRLSGNVMTGEQEVPLATYETTLWPSVRRGAHVSTMVDGGIQATLIDERMARSVIFEADDAPAALAAARRIEADLPALQAVVSETSRFARLIDVNHQIVGNLLFLRFEFATGDAAGHNMVTLASDKLMAHVLHADGALQYSSISGNYCTDKKASAVNGILGRGKNVVTEIVIPEEIVRRRLRTSADKMAHLNVRKNLIGGAVAGSLRSANAHYANMLLGFYLATGQDAANIVEGSQGFTHAESRDGDLYFSCTIPNLIVGSVGNGKGLDVVTENLHRLGCAEDREPGDNARRLAVLCAATVLCGELSLMAAQTNPGELMAAHVQFERNAR